MLEFVVVEKATKEIHFKAVVVDQPKLHAPPIVTAIKIHIAVEEYVNPHVHPQLNVMPLRCVLMASAAIYAKMNKPAVE